MPVMTGLEAAARIRQRGSRVPIVCVSTYDEADVRQAALLAGVAAFVLKSALAVDLIPAVRAALAGANGD
jgi:DNA-binding NarL/FixJ family response regulator